MFLIFVSSNLYVRSGYIFSSKFGLMKEPEKHFCLINNKSMNLGLLYPPIMQKRLENSDPVTLPKWPEQ